MTDYQGNGECDTSGSECQNSIENAVNVVNIRVKVKNYFQSITWVFSRMMWMDRETQVFLYMLQHPCRVNQVCHY